MWYFQRTDPFPSLLNGKYVSFAGSGGKSSLIDFVARRARREGKTVVVTTTTKIYAREPFFTLEENGLPAGSIEGYVRVGKTLADGKLTAVSFEDVRELGARFDLVLIEADGAKGRPLKYPAFHEPVIPPFSESVIVVSGLGGFGGRVDQEVFRWELLGKATGIEGDSPVTKDVFLRLFSDDGYLKGVDRTRCRIILNQYDCVMPRRAAFAIAKSIAERAGAKVIVSSLLYAIFYSLNRA
jgi:probable selenium-dependent hydroxylase accessory protein YqeC